MRKIIPICLMLMVLAGCATVRKVETGVNTVGERLTFNLTGPWNHVDFPGIKPGQVWTMEGIFVDELVIYSGIKSGERMHQPNSAGSKAKDIVFDAKMGRDEVVSMFEGVLARDGSLISRKRVAPSIFGGRPGVLFEFERTRKEDGLKQLGFGYAAIDRQELFALVYAAPAITFFERHKASVQEIARSAAIRSEGASSDSSAVTFLSVNIAPTNRSQTRTERSPTNPDRNDLKSNASSVNKSSASTKPEGVKERRIEQRLTELKRLYETGLITKENFIDQQKRLLGSMD